MTFDELTITTIVLIIGGSEIVAMQLSGVMYYLLSNPSALAKLTADVRGAFKTQNEINMVSTNSLSYLSAVLSEIPANLPRICSASCSCHSPRMLLNRWPVRSRPDLGISQPLECLSFPF